MSDNAKIAELEALLLRFLEPMKDIPFHLIMRSISRQEIIPVDKKGPKYAALIKCMTQIAEVTARLIREKPIERPRPNEVGNDIEKYVLLAAKELNILASRPTTQSGKGKSTGYPDLLLEFGEDVKLEPIYLECKAYNADLADSTMRSFYVSPSSDFKVTQTAHHLLLGFSIQVEELAGQRIQRYTVKAFSLADLYHLKCDVKYEFNGDNRRLYDPSIMIAKGDL
jgi:hypothetical protein